MDYWPIGMAVLTVLLLLGVPISMALAGVGLAGVASIIGWMPALSLIGSAFFDKNEKLRLFFFRPIP